MTSVFAQTIVWRERRGNWGKSELVWSNQMFAHPSLHPICPVLQHARPSMLCNMLGERSQMSLELVSLKDLPHTYSCTCFYSKEKQKWKQEGLCRGRIPGSQNFIQSENVFIWSTKFLFYFYFIYFMLLYIYFFSWQAKWWVTTQGGNMRQGCTSLCGILTWKNLPSDEQKCKS